MNKEDTFIINISKEDIRQIANEQIELHENKGRRYGYIALFIFLTSYAFLLYLIGIK